MKKLSYALFSVFIFGLVLIGFSQKDETTLIAQKENPTKATADNSDKESLKRLTRNLYKWYETKSSKDEFNPKTSKSQDSSYVGIDWVLHSKRLKELEKTGFFSVEFLDNYTKIAKKIDRDLKDRKTQWLVGDLPPFGNDANPWCNCQDNPANYWNIITISDIKPVKSSTTFKWTWDHKTFYKANAIKRDGSWKISYLQGFDYDKFINQ